MGRYDVLPQLGSGLFSAFVTVAASVAPIVNGTAQPWTQHDQSAKQVLTVAAQPQPPQAKVAARPKTPDVFPVFAPLSPVVDCSQVACLALTFDDGPNPATTPQIVDTLERFHVPATFFMVGSRVPGNAPLLQRMQADGLEIGNHSWSHPDLTTLPDDQIAQQVGMTQDAITATGVAAPHLFRPPYGAIDARSEAAVHMPIMLWNEDPRDWAANTPQEVIQSVEASAKPGGITDLHDIYHVTADALPQIITDLQSRGYHFVTVSQLLDLHPDSQGLFYGLRSVPSPAS